MRFWTMIPFWKPQAIYLLVLSRKMAKNDQKYPPQGAEVKNPKFDQPHAGMCIFFVLAKNVVKSSESSQNIHMSISECCLHWISTSEGVKNRKNWKKSKKMEKKEKIV